MTQEEREAQLQRRKFQEVQVEASEKALSRATKNYNESSKIANDDILNPRKIKACERDAENVFTKASCMEDELSKLQALTAADQWEANGLANDGLFNTIRGKSTQVQEHFQTLWANHLEAVKEQDTCMSPGHDNPSAKHRVELSLKPAKVQSSVNHMEFRVFRKAFCNFLHASGLSESDGGSKLVLAHLRSCIQDSFLIKLEAKQEPENSAQLYLLIEQYIEKTHPLVLRRLRFFKMKQDRNQLFSDFLQRVREEEISCELSKMSPRIS